MREHWNERAACVGVDERIFFPPAGKTANHARQFCAACPVRAECLRDALKAELGERRFGIYGGLMAPERAELVGRKR